MPLSLQQSTGTQAEHIITLSIHTSNTDASFSSKSHLSAKKKIKKKCIIVFQGVKKYSSPSPILPFSGTKDMKCQNLVSLYFKVM